MKDKKECDVGRYKMHGVSYEERQEYEIWMEKLRRKTTYLFMEGCIYDPYESRR